MSVLVIGGTGFIGPRMVRKLVEKAEQFGATPLERIAPTPSATATLGTY